LLLLLLADAVAEDCGGISTELHVIAAGYGWGKVATVLAVLFILDGPNSQQFAALYIIYCSSKAMN